MKTANRIRTHQKYLFGKKNTSMFDAAKYGDAVVYALLSLVFT